MDPAGLAILVVCAKGALAGASVGALVGLSKAKWRQLTQGTTAQASGGSPSEAPPLLTQLARGGPGPVQVLPTPEGLPATENGPPEPLALDAETAESAARNLLEAGVTPTLPQRDFLDLLRRLSGEAPKLLNDRFHGRVPQESRAATVIMDELACFCGRTGPLERDEWEFRRDRKNLVVTYPGRGPETVAFLGAHLDLAPAPKVDEEAGHHSREYSSLTGLAHAALLTLLLCELARTQPPLERSVVVVFSAAGEGFESGIGVDELLRNQYLEGLRAGPLFWLHSSAACPNIPGALPAVCSGFLGSIGWVLRAHGVRSHSAMPQNGINSIELANEALTFVQQGFYSKFGEHPLERPNGFPVGSSFKPTCIDCRQPVPGQICAETYVSGDLRITPFYEMEAVILEIETLVAEFNSNLSNISSRGPCSSFVVANPQVAGEEDQWLRGRIEIEWSDRPNRHTRGSPRASASPRRRPGCPSSASRRKRVSELAKDMEGVVIPQTSLSRQILTRSSLEVRLDIAHEATEQRCFISSASIPHVRRFQEAGFDLQLCSFASEAADESSLLPEITMGWKVLLRILSNLEAVSGAALGHDLSPDETSVLQEAERAEEPEDSAASGGLPEQGLEQESLQETPTGREGSQVKASSSRGPRLSPGSGRPRLPKAATNARSSKPGRTVRVSDSPAARAVQEAGPAGSPAGSWAGPGSSTPLMGSTPQGSKERSGSLPFSSRLAGSGSSGWFGGWRLRRGSSGLSEPLEGSRGPVPKSRLSTLSKPIVGAMEVPSIRRGRRGVSNEPQGQGGSSSASSAPKRNPAPAPDWLGPSPAGSESKGVPLPPDFATPRCASAGSPAPLEPARSRPASLPPASSKGELESLPSAPEFSVPEPDREEVAHAEEEGTLRVEAVSCSPRKAAHREEPQPITEEGELSEEEPHGPVKTVSSRSVVAEPAAASAGDSVLSYMNPINLLPIPWWLLTAQDQAATSTTTPRTRESTQPS